MLGTGVPTVAAPALNDPTYGNTYKWKIFTAAKNILYTVANSNAVENSLMVKAQSVNLTTANNNADGVAKTFIVGTPVTYSLKDDVAANRTPTVNYGDRSKVQYTYSIAPGSKLPKGLALKSDGTIFGTPLEITHNANGQSSTMSVAILIHATGEGSGVSEGQPITYNVGRQLVTLRVNADPTATTPFTLPGKLLGRVDFNQNVNFKIDTATGGAESDLFDVYYYPVSLPEGLSLYMDGTVTGRFTGEDGFTATLIVEAKKFAMMDVTIDGVTYEAGEFTGESATGVFYINVGKSIDDIGAGQTPFIGENGNWWIGDTDTEVKAQGPAGQDGEDGKDGLTPFIGENGNWWIGETDTGIKAQGPKRGEPGPKGDKGDKGDQGEPGLQGPAGQDGQDGEDGQMGSRS